MSYNAQERIQFVQGLLARDWVIGRVDPKTKTTPGKHRHVLLTEDAIPAYVEQSGHGGVSVFTGPRDQGAWEDGTPRRGSDVVVLDFDKLGLLGYLQDEFNRGDPFDTLTARTPREGGGVHLYFSYTPERDDALRNKQLIPGALDVRTGGGYVVAYEFDDPDQALAPIPDELFQWLVERQGGPAQRDAEQASGDGWREHNAKNEAELLEILKYQKGDTYDNWRHVGCAIFELGWGDVGFRIWDDWSQETQNPDPHAKSGRYHADGQLKAWASFGRHYPHAKVTVASLYADAQKAGWKPQQPDAPHTDAELAAELEALRADEFEAPGPFPAEDIIAQLGGPLREFVDWIQAASRADNPALALGAGLSGCAGALGRRVIGPTGARSRLLLAVLAETGAGKDVLQECVCNFFQWHRSLNVGWETETPYHRAQLDNWLIKYEGQMMLLLDEYAEPLKAWTESSGKHGAVSPVMRKLLTLGRVVFKLMPLSPKHPYMVEHGARWGRGVYAPAVSVLGCTTQGAFFNALSQGSLIDGLLGRHLVVVSEVVGEPKTPTASTRDFPEKLREWADALAELPVPPTDTEPPDEPGAAFVKSTGGALNCELEIPWDEGAEESFRELELKLHHEANRFSAAGLEYPAALLRRLRGQVATLALVIACSETLNPREARISRDHLLLAYRIARWSAQYVGAKVRHGVAETPYAKAMQKVRNRIASAGPKWTYKSKLAQLRDVSQWVDRIWKSLSESAEFECDGRRVRLREE